MTTRPLFRPDLPDTATTPGVKQDFIPFQWVPGFAKSRQEQCLANLQKAIANSGLAKRPLEISTRSDNPYGQALSALRLELGGVPIEVHYQSAKVYPDGLGPHPEWLNLSPTEYKAEIREFKERVAQNRLRLEAFVYEKQSWPLNPPHAFYDWLYCTALCENPQLAHQLLSYDGFTDLAFNPMRSYNSQAYAAAFYASLAAFGLLEEALSSHTYFFELHPHEPLIHPKSNKRSHTDPYKELLLDL